MMPTIHTANRTLVSAVDRPCQETTNRSRLLVITVAILMVVAGILAFSPNFRPGTPRTSPLGSDFLQEWIGGSIWRSPQRSLLYDASYYRHVQHDPSLTGFGWPIDQYYPMVYPPFYYLLVSPLAGWDYSTATVIWLLLLGLFAVLSVYCFTRFFEPARQHWLKILLVLIAFHPFVTSLNMAQKSVILLLILCLTYLLLYHRRNFMAGAIFGLIAFKPHLGLLIGLVMLLKREWRFVGGAATSVSLLILLSLVAGPDLCRDYFQQSLAMTNYSQHGGYQLHDAQNLAGAVELTFGHSSLFSRWVWWLLAGLVVALLTVIMQERFDFRSRRFGLQFSGLIVGTILLSPHFYTYDLTVLLLPLALMAFACSQASSPAWSTPPWRLRENQRRWIGLLCVAIFLGCAVTSEIAAQFHFQLTTLLLMLVLCATACICSGASHDSGLIATQP